MPKAGILLVECLCRLCRHGGKCVSKLSEIFLRTASLSCSKCQKQVKARVQPLLAFGILIESSKLIEFGSRAQASREAISFAHYCSKSQKGWFRVKRRISRKKFQKKVRDMDQWLKENQGMKVSLLVKKVNQKLRGHYQYYGITDNSRMVVQYSYETRKALFKWLNRRSQRRSYIWEEFNELLKYCLLGQLKIYHSIYKRATQT